MQKARWSTAIATAALIALPVAGSAQSTQSAPPQNPPAQQSQPPASTTPQQPPASATPTQPAASAQSDTSAAKTHLREARESLSQITAMPEAAKLEGPARAQMSQLIADFNALITTQSDWRSAYAKVDSDVTAILGPDSGDKSVSTSGTGTVGATGTSGSTSAAASATDAPAPIDAAIRGKLVEFRTHLAEFNKAAGGDAAASSSSSNESLPPSAATSTTANPANPAQNPAQNPASASPSTPTPTGTSGVSSTSPTANMAQSDRAKAASEVSAAANADAQKELDAISGIVDSSKTGTLTKAQTAEIKQHLEVLRALLAQK
jgi:hypothetical protein